MTTNVLTGTPLYLAPEAVKGDQLVNARSDLYVVGYLLLTAGRASGERARPRTGAGLVCGEHGVVTRPGHRAVGRLAPRAGRRASDARDRSRRAVD